MTALAKQYTEKMERQSKYFIPCTQYSVTCSVIYDLLTSPKPNSPEANRQLKTISEERKASCLPPPTTPNYTPSQRATHTIRNQRNPQRGRR
jgi:hypothetical protein